VEKLDRSKLWSLEQYAAEREEFRALIIDHKRLRKVKLGPHATLFFEDFLTMKYQVQEMLRVERIFEPDEIAEEIASYNPLIPDGHNWKATLMLEYSDVSERASALARMTGVEHEVWMRIEEHPPVFALANEDMERSTEEKTAAVHFLRFELDTEMIRSLKDKACLTAGINHQELGYRIDVPPATRNALVRDLR
jgi:hypothetical protein